MFTDPTNITECIEFYPLAFVPGGRAPRAFMGTAVLSPVRIRLRTFEGTVSSVVKASKELSDQVGPGCTGRYDLIMIILGYRCVTMGGGGGGAKPHDHFLEKWIEMK